MIKTRKNSETAEKTDKNVRRKLVKDPETGLTFLSGPSITKEKVEKDFPEDSDHDVINLRRSVGL